MKMPANSRFLPFTDSTVFKTKWFLEQPAKLLLCFGDCAVGKVLGHHPCGPVGNFCPDLLKRLQHAVQIYFCPTTKALKAASWRFAGIMDHFSIFTDFVESFGAGKLLRTKTLLSINEGGVRVVHALVPFKPGHRGDGISDHPPNIKKQAILILRTKCVRIAFVRAISLLGTVDLARVWSTVPFFLPRNRGLTQGSRKTLPLLPYV